MRHLKRQRAVLSDRSNCFYADKCVVITGAAGSIGSALAAELADLGCSRLVLLDHVDHGLLTVAEHIGRSNRSLDVVDALCDIRDRERLSRWMRRVRPDVVMHAAALKHVHFGERHPSECVLTNLVGVRNALQAALEAGAQHFTLVSTDKAASPVCVMGATKRLAELHLTGFEHECGGAITLKSVRFGNVIGSQGSVVPRFTAQIAEGGPIEVTHADMERFFMSVEDAVGLILNVTCAEDGFGAYFMEMGDPVSIVELGREMIARSGRDIGIEFTGLRPGEKLKEELFDAAEVVSATTLAGVFQVSPRSIDAAVYTAEVDRLEQVARTCDDAVVVRRLFALLDARLGREERAVG
ncbi:MAG: SDR family NAD(P)-dependent oxidoreductase [Proteobacteria bacterium]|nr:SDR family NAD(P)-dependent oxidoreductase [Pseudomonadota bacterium]